MQYKHISFFRNHFAIVAALFVCGGFVMGCSSNSNNKADAENFGINEMQDCEACPVMVALPAGSFLMGTAEADRLTDPRTGKPAVNDGPQHLVNIAYPIMMGKFEVSSSQFSDFVAATGYQTTGPCMEFSPPESFTISQESNWQSTGFSQVQSSPVICVSYFDASAYANWLSSATGKNYRLPSEAEWEYAARAGTVTPYYWGASAAAACDYANVRSAGADSISKRQAESDIVDGFPCDDGYAHSSPIGSFAANAFGLHDMQGNAWEWVTDCNHKNYVDAPTNGSPWLDERGCQFGVIRGGSFLNRVERSSATVRAGRPREGRATNMGFRVVRDDRDREAAIDVAGAAVWQTDTAGNVGSGDTGKALFKNNCIACHVRQDDFRGAYGTDQAALETTIRDGGNNIMSMPAFGEVLSGDEISALATYVRQQNNWTD